MITCAAILIVNLTPTWTANDQKVVQSAMQRCAVYFPAAPCLKKFIKKKELVYNAICTKETK